MFQKRLVFSLLAFFSMVALADQPKITPDNTVYPVTTVSGEQVNVTGLALKHAFDGYLSKLNAGSFDSFLNSDGSVTIRHPNFSYNGSRYDFITGYWRQNGDNFTWSDEPARGICHFLGFKRKVIVTDATDQGALKGSQFIEVDCDGKLKSVWSLADVQTVVGSGNNTAYTAKILDTITCADPL